MTNYTTDHGVRSEHVVVPVPDQTAPDTETARLCFDSGLENVTLRAAKAEALVEARFTAPLPVVWADGLNVHVDYPLGSRLLRRSPSNEIVLNAASAWAIDVHGGAQHLDADLRDVAVRSIAFHSGAAHLQLSLGRPVEPCTIRLSAVSNVVLDRPADVPVQLRIAGGAVRVRLDDRYYGAIGKGLVDHTGDLSRPGYTVVIGGGADTVTVAGRAS
jgi:hypothetical protein